MRYLDASHVDQGSFYARNPCQGKIYRLLGYIGLVLAVMWADQPWRLTCLLVILVMTWLIAWYQVVGTLWRSTLVAACLVCAMRLSLRELGIL